MGANERVTQGPAWPTRRSLLALGAGGTFAGAAEAAPPDSATLLAAGPEDGPVAQWAARLGIWLGRLLPQAAVIRVQFVGAGDGVAAANRFATAAAPDGRMLLALSATAVQSRAAGDSRARFDPSVWLPLCGAAMPAVLAGRGPLPRRGTTLRLGLWGPDAPDAAALLALDAAGVSAAPVFGVPPGAAEAALAQGAVDAALLAGPRLVERMAVLGVQPWLAAEAAAGGRELSLPDVPSLSEHPGLDRPALLAACRLGFAAFRTRGLAVLPALTSAGVLAGWRAAAQRWVEEEAREPTDMARPLDAAEAAALLAALCPSAEALRAYRDWLGRRLNWRAV